MSSKRMSMMPAAPATPVHFVSGAGSVVMADAVAVIGTYPVTISAESVIHPRSRLDAKGGPINIGRRCIVDERAVIGGGGGAAGMAAESRSEGSVTLSDYVTVETGALVEAGVSVGQGSVVGVRSHIGTGALIGRYCTLAPQTTIAPGERLLDFTVAYGNGQRRRDNRVAAAEVRHKQQARKIEVLRKLVASVPEKYVPTT